MGIAYFRFNFDGVQFLTFPLKTLFTSAVFSLGLLAEKVEL